MWLFVLLTNVSLPFGFTVAAAIQIRQHERNIELPSNGEQ
jgi:hypothetical protein